MRIGILFAGHDVPSLKSRQVDAVVIAPSCPVDEAAIADALGVTVINLNDLIEKGEMSPLSRDCARFIRQALRDIDLPTEALASQHDLYQYHLRKQYLFQTALTRFLDSGHAVLEQKHTLVFPFKRLARYESPMRPELDRFFRDFRTFGFLASMIADQRGVLCEFTDRLPGAVARLVDQATFATRHLLMHSYMLIKLTRKILAARRNSRSTEICSPAAVGIIVRTDSEAISAKALVEDLTSHGITTLIIQDELIASETTANRLCDLGIDYVSVGGASGMPGLITALTAPWRKKRKAIARAIRSNLTTNGAFMAVPHQRWANWMAERLFDFGLLQRHFAAELDSLIRSHDLQLLVTFAYVDQWGPVIQLTGQKAGLKTICVQNAAQLPEEFSRLAWSDHYCVESMYLKERLIALGYPKNKITATGLPHYSKNAVEQENLSKTEGKKTILLITQPIYGGYYMHLIEWLAEYCGARDLELALKYHPRQNGDEYSEALLNAERYCGIKIFHREELEVALSTAKVCVSVMSAAIFKAINVGVPTISFLPKSEKYLDVHYCSEDNIFVAETTDELREILDLATDNFQDFFEQFEKRRQNFFDKHLMIEPSSVSAQNIVGVLNDHLNKCEN